MRLSSIFIASCTCCLLIGCASSGNRNGARSSTSSDSASVYINEGSGQDALFHLMPGTEETLRHILEATMVNDTGALRLVVDDADDSKMYINGWWYRENKSVYGYFRSIKQPDGTWTFPPDLQFEKPLCAAKIPSFPERFILQCAQDNAELQQDEKLKNELLPYVSSAFSMPDTNIIITFANMNTVDGYVYAGWFPRIQADARIVQYFIAIKQKKWHLDTAKGILGQWIFDL